MTERTINAERVEQLIDVFDPTSGPRHLYGMADGAFHLCIAGVKGGRHFGI